MKFLLGDVVRDGIESLKVVEKIGNDIVTLRYLHNPSQEFVHCTRSQNLELVSRFHLDDDQSLGN